MNQEQLHILQHSLGVDQYGQGEIVTESGKAAVRCESPKPPKLTRSQKRYREFLNEDCGASFGEWLKWRRA